MDVGYKNGYRRLEGLAELLQEIKALVKGFNESTGQYGGGGINEVNNKLEAVKTKLDTLDVSVKLDDPDIAQINSKLGDVKTDVHTIATNSGTQGTDIHNIYTLLDDRLMRKEWVEEDDYQAAKTAGTLREDTLYIRIVEQTNP